jgi:uncharacterized membrane protein YkoI
MNTRFLPLGILLLALGCAEHHHHHGGDEQEVKVSIDQVPPAVRETLLRESGGAAIKTVDMETDDGKTTYEADAKIGGENWEIKVSPDGKLLSKKIDHEKDEDNKDEKGMKDKD